MNPPPEPAPLPTMAGKPVFHREAKSIINLESGFKPKLLSDGPTFSLGDACVYSCLYCYVPDIMRKAAYMPRQVPHADSVVRRRGAIEILIRELTLPAKGGGRKRKYESPEDDRIIFTSPLVESAANSELMDETAEACSLILRLTNWRIRILSKSAALHRLAKKIEAKLSVNGPPAISAGLWALPNAGEIVRSRMLFGASAGTLDDKLAASFELGTPLVSKRIQDIHRLQDDGYQTFGMICPSLPQRNPEGFSRDWYEALRTVHMPDVWAEVINVRGENMVKTCSALRAAGYEWEAESLELVAKEPAEWEQYSRETFEAHAKYFRGKLRFLQYVTASNRSYWQEKVALGAVLL